jgi:hypothetical protein
VTYETKRRNEEENSIHRQNATVNVGKIHIPADLVVAQEASDVESDSRLDFLLLHNLRRRFIA